VAVRAGCRTARQVHRAHNLAYNRSFPQNASVRIHHELASFGVVDYTPPWMLLILPRWDSAQFDHALSIFLVGTTVGLAIGVILRIVNRGGINHDPFAD
jgi:hypothetical protein